MSGHSGRSQTIWIETQKGALDRPPLAEDTRTDVCIVGAGIAGLTVAYCLAREGKRVAVLDDGPIGGGMTACTTAHLSNAIEHGYANLERLHGQTGARIAAQSHTSAIDRIEAFAADEHIACDFERLDGYLFLPSGESPEDLQRELEAVHRSGLSEVELLDRAPLASLDATTCLRFPRQAQFHPLKYLGGLAHAVERRGGRIFTGTHAHEIEGGARARVTTSRGRTITADALVIATNTPVTDLVTIHTKQAPYTTYVIGARIIKGSVPKALYWDTLDPYHYVRLHDVQSDSGGTYQVLIVGGEDHKSGQATDGDKRYALLESWARRRFPKIERIEYRWSGQVMESVDSLGFIGRDPGAQPNVYVATGDCGMGMTHGTLAGIIITDLILGRENEWATLYEPSRKTLKAAGTYVKDALNVAAQYTEWITGGDVNSSEDIPRNTGAVLRRGLTKIAAYRDGDGKLHERSATCPHLGCIVAWNATEQTWDCPCHGSRFDKLGKVINGPANSDLDPV